MSKAKKTITGGNWGLSRGRLMRVVATIKNRPVVVCGVHDIGRLGADKEGDQEANGLVLAASKQGLELAMNTYLALLKIPPKDLWRVTRQELYAAHRDYIAAATGRTPEDVQNDFEEMANYE